MGHSGATRDMISALARHRSVSRLPWALSSPGHSSPGAALSQAGEHVLVWSSFSSAHSARSCFGWGEAPWLHRCWSRVQGQHRDRAQPGHRSLQGPSASSGTDSSGDNKIPRKTAELGTKGIKRSLWADFEDKTYKNKLRWTQGQVGRVYQHQCVPPPEEEEESPTNTITNVPARDPGH